LIEGLRRASSGVQGQSLWLGGQKLNAFLYYHKPRSGPICPEICLFCKTKHFDGRLAPWIRQWINP